MDLSFPPAPSTFTTLQRINRKRKCSPGLGLSIISLIQENPPDPGQLFSELPSKAITMALLPKLTPYMCNIRQFSISSCLLKSRGEVEIPKRPLTPWSSYYASNFPEVKARNPSLRSAEIMRILRLENFKLNRNEWIRTTNILVGTGRGSQKWKREDYRTSTWKRRRNTGQN